MECYVVQKSDDFLVPAEQQCGRDPISPSTNGWFHCGVSEFESAGFPSKHSGTSTKKSLVNLNSDTRASSHKEGKVPQVSLVERSTSSSTFEDCFIAESSMRTSDDFFHDLLDFEMQNSMQKMDDNFLNSFVDQDLMHLENPCGLYDATNYMHLPWNLRMDVIDDLETMTENSTRREGADPNLREAHLVELSPITYSSPAVVASEPVCMEATVLQELENVVLKLNSKTRICIRDALYRLANRSKEQHNLNLCQSETVVDRPSYSEICCGNSRQQLSRSLESRTNVIDRAIATLMFDRSEISAVLEIDFLT